MPGPSDDELLAYLDGGLKESRRAEIERQLERSWELRVRLEDIRRDVETYVRARAEESLPEFPDAGTVWAALSARLQAGAAVTARRREFSRWRRPAVAAAAAVGLIAVTRLGAPRPVSAGAVLERAQAAEDRRLHRIPQPVIHERFRASKTARPGGDQVSVVWEMWTAGGAGSPLQRIDVQASAKEGGRPAARVGLYEELSNLLRRNELDARRPLSPAGYARWLKRVHPPRVRVTRQDAPQGTRSYVVTAELAEPPQPGLIYRCDYTVGAADWLPLEQRLAVREGEGWVEYQIARTGFEVVSYGSLPVGFFAAPQRPLPATQARRESVVPEKMTGQLPNPAPPAEKADLRSRVITLFAAHVQGLCTQPILEAGAAPRTAPSWLQPPPEGGPGGADYEALAVSGISLLMALEADAAAIETVIRQVPPEDVARLDPVGSTLWTRMVSEHLTAAAANADRLRELLSGWGAAEPDIASPREAEAPEPLEWPKHLAQFAEELRRFSRPATEAGSWSSADPRVIAAAAGRLAQRARFLAQSAATAVASLRQVSVDVVRAP